MLRARQIIKQFSTGPGFITTLSNFIIRPPRSQYQLTDLGPQVFRIGQGCTERFRRVDFELQNMRGMTIQCSWFKSYKQRCQPCVVYCHANCGSRRDGLETLFLLRYGFSIFTFDFCGCGMSDGEYISLGFYERQDLAAVIQYLSSLSAEVDGIALWGRSMGAVTAIMYASKDSSIQCVVCDSPFASLRRLITDLVAQHGGRAAQYLPNLVINSVVQRIRKNIVTLAAFDIDDLNTVKYAKQCAVPALIIHGKEDDFVLPQQSMSVADAFYSPCIHELVSGTHNDERDSRTQQLIAAFLHLYLVDKRHHKLHKSNSKLLVQSKLVKPLSMVQRCNKKEEEEEKEEEERNEHLPYNNTVSQQAQYLANMSNDNINQLQSASSLYANNVDNEIDSTHIKCTNYTKTATLQNFSNNNDSTTLLCEQPKPLQLHPPTLVPVQLNDICVQDINATPQRAQSKQQQQQQQQQEEQQSQHSDLHVDDNKQLTQQEVL